MIDIVSELRTQARGQHEYHYIYGRGPVGIWRRSGGLPARSSSSPWAALLDGDAPECTRSAIRPRNRPCSVVWPHAKIQTVNTYMSL
eukprot:COSAG01_NODE_1425_length_10350_cov_38.096283_13_plen_87_part_00